MRAAEAGRAACGELNLLKRRRGRAYARMNRYDSDASFVLYVDSSCRSDSRTGARGACDCSARRSRDGNSKNQAGSSASQTRRRGWPCHIVVRRACVARSPQLCQRSRDASLVLPSDTASRVNCLLSCVPTQPALSAVNRHPCREEQSLLCVAGSSSVQHTKRGPEAALAESCACSRRVPWYLSNEKHVPKTR